MEARIKRSSGQLSIRKIDKRKEFDFMYYIALCLGFIVVFYFGEILGLKAQCENSKYLYPAKDHVWLVPVIQFLVLVTVLIDCIKQRKADLLFAFFRTGGTGIVILGCFSNVIQTMPNKQRKSSNVHRPLILQTTSSVMSTLASAT